MCSFYENDIETLRFEMNVHDVMLYFSQDNMGNNMLHNI